MNIVNMAGTILYAATVSVLKAALVEAVKKGANLDGANLRGANLDGADLDGADLRGANLRGANLYGADLRGANLYGADLRGANLDGANLRGANLDGANLYGADLDGADLDGADLYGTKSDFFAVLSSAQNEVAGLYKALVDGLIDGVVYRGDCACLVGTIANVRGCDYQELGSLAPDATRPAERWFLAIRRGDTPENNKVSAITKDWLTEYMTEHAIAIPSRTVVWT